MRAQIIGLVLVGLLHDGIAAPGGLAALRSKIEQRVDHGPKHRLTKAELRPRLKVVMRLLERCYREALSLDPKTDATVRAAKDGHCAEAVVGAERGLRACTEVDIKLVE